MTHTAEEAVRGLWRTLSARDWDALGDYLAEDCLYIDVPTGPALAAKGPVDIVKRLRVGLADLASYVNHDGLLVADGDAVIYEHSETWTFTSGEVVDLAFCSVHRVREGRVTLWKDYWDFAAVADHAPPGWIDSLAAADMSWIHDATGEV
ncbi:MAG: nuclear transport factor 2 family protein [Nocardioides sp.]|uniref:nuclear transport factor 2 family protein n=1 Tax=Nocardioides sp. TaxID=35761 RepID=UPI00238C9F57|nr:nuclear transport factor 2 family protein [Nocardioides sp.]MDE0774847.1 nuclear transport factor 2 family protein [Nocardioides sp.]